MSSDENTDNLTYGFMPNSEEPAVSKLLLNKLLLSDVHNLFPHREDNSLIACDE
jgi:hypothetical protein